MKVTRMVSKSIRSNRNYSAILATPRLADIAEYSRLILVSRAFQAVPVSYYKYLKMFDQPWASRFPSGASKGILVESPGLVW